MGVLDRIFERMALFLALLGGGGLFLAIGITCLSSLLRFLGRVADFFLGRVLDPSLWQLLSPILGEEEIVTYAIGAALFAFLPWAMLKRGHIRIDIFERCFGLWGNRVLDLIADMSLAFVAYMVLTRQWFLIFKKVRRSQPSIADLLASGQGTDLFSRVRVNPETQILAMKQWPFYVFAEFCIAVFLVIAVYCAFCRLLAFFPNQTKEAGCD